MPARKGSHSTIADQIERVFLRVFETPNECDSNFEPANFVDGLYFLGRAIHRLAEAVERLTRKSEEECDNA